MNFGNISGLVNGTEQIVFDYEVNTSFLTSIDTGNILNGNEDGWYTIIHKRVGVSGSGTTGLTFNNDSGSNYDYREIAAHDNSVIDNSHSSQPSIPIAFSQNNATGFTIANIYAKSGSVRLMNASKLEDIEPTLANVFIFLGGYAWNNTTDNLTSMQFLDAFGFRIGDRFIILKSNNFTNGTPTGTITTPYIKGSWLRVGSQVLGSPASSVTFSGLDGDRDVLYQLILQEKRQTGSNSMSIRINNDSANNYGYQYFSAQNTSVSANKGSNDSILCYTGALADNEYAYVSMLLFAKSGFLRPMIVNGNANEVAAIGGINLNVVGNSWNNTTDNITEIKCLGSYAIGSQFDLYALRPNG